ncbi:ATP-dependent RNA helicase HelY [Friedmanniella endophytica]|uniref:ATP-dependent RNA helicase HelY n=1 Tax=Microlunatus kandeliicorticis TaxID=1759536 RepID=A0A7W3IU30_9ACTN|nr:DEAD/DEAH box helicase [Microlunatus kandeliicorticis]MBA8795244.1 ATP-dependent RNA helicase HelY [Microlunatus kandeliicorticis]
MSTQPADDSAASPAESYARFRRNQVSPALTEFADGYGFGFDDYQREACEHVEAGSGVLVAAPTGAGKTIVGEFAVFLALREGRKCFYTTPIKALSNQKYADLVRRHGSGNVGLLTGDSSINSEAPVVVMTTEVLRNMIYANSSTLTDLGYVVMDEVHYLADRFRGAVWEEVIIGLADSVQVVALSATVSNAEEFGDWLAAVRGEMRVVVSERRPVPLFQHVLVGRKLFDLFAGEAPTAQEIASQRRADVNPQLLRVSRDESRVTRDDARRPRGRSGKGKRAVSYGSGRYGGATHARNLDRGQGGAGNDRGGDRGGDRRAHHGTSRADMVGVLERARLLPAIVFIFSRAGCDAAVRQLLGTSVELTDLDEQAQLTAIAERHMSGLSAADRKALGYEAFFTGFVRGIAAHHAGLLPAFKECVEEGFVRGLVKVVFATETLALGINMPARSVVLEKLVKYNGETHADITPGEYTQLTGRAGRRGIDVEGHAVVLWQPGLDPRAVAGLASRRTYPLHSSFAPTYNMAVNLIGAVGRDRARTLLEQSFAQYQSDRSVVGIARQIEKNTDEIAARFAAAACDQGDFVSYARTRDEISRVEAEAARDRKADRRDEALASLQGLTRGALIRVPAGRSRGWAVVLDPGVEGQRAAPQPQVLTEDSSVRRLALTDFPTPALTAGRVKVPKHFHPKDKAARRNLAAALRARLATVTLDPDADRPSEMNAAARTRVADLRAELQRHPCHTCPDRETHFRQAAVALRLEAENRAAEQRMSSRTTTIAKQFDKITTVLEGFGYLAPDESGQVRVSPSGRMLARIYAELDLVTAECLRAGVFDDLTVPQLAAVLSSLIYEARRTDGGRFQPRMPDRVTEEAMTAVRRVHREVSLAERDARLDRGPEPDIGFARAAFGWAAGRPLAQVLDDNDLTAGDFVRWVRQVIDFAGQIADAAGPSPVRETAHQTVRAMRRGVVAFEPDDPTPGDDLSV